MDINQRDMTAQLTHLGIQCVRKKDAAASLKQRQDILVDPFKTKFHHINGPVNLNAVRLCFQAFLSPTPGSKLVPVQPVVSNIIHDRKADVELSIVDCSDNCADVTGGKKILIFCEKVVKDDIEVRFDYTDEGTAFEKIIPLICKVRNILLRQNCFRK